MIPWHFSELKVRSTGLTFQIKSSHEFMFICSCLVWIVLRKQFAKNIFWASVWNRTISATVILHFPPVLVDLEMICDFKPDIVNLILLPAVYNQTNGANKQWNFGARQDELSWTSVFIVMNHTYPQRHPRVGACESSPNPYCWALVKLKIKKSYVSSAAHLISH